MAMKFGRFCCHHLRGGVTTNVGGTAFGFGCSSPPSRWCHHLTSGRIHPGKRMRVTTFAVVSPPYHNDNGKSLLFPSPPSRWCGLKLANESAKTGRLIVTTFAVVWIEIQILSEANARHLVTTFAVVWIEIDVGA